MEMAFHLIRPLPGQFRQLARFLSLPGLLLGLALLGGCATHRLQLDQGELVPDYALPPARSGDLYEISRKVLQETGPEDSAFLPMPDNLDALRWRLLLTGLAQQSIDMQYYLWDGDESGDLLALHLLDAADRGVQIRVLVDDIFMLDKDTDIVAFDRHPNIEVRVFNPWYRRGSLFQWGMEYFGFGKRLNQRMHNKLFVVDNRIAIVGGRNLGNAYFGLSDKYNFRDIEVLATGPVAQDISDSFDLYWNDEWAVPGEAFADPGRELPPEGVLREAMENYLAASQKLDAAGLGSPSEWRINLDWLAASSSIGPVWVVYDDPPSAVAQKIGVRKIEKMGGISKDTRRELLVASPYFIPNDEIMGNLQALTDRGVSVKVLTNSMASTNHTMVNSGYRPWRRPIVEAGVELYEYRADAADRDEVNAAGVQPRFQSLHTKTFVIDREFVYIGSLNIDPRSLDINTEMGLLIYDPVLAQQVAALLEADMQPRNAWRVELDEKGRMQWRSSAGTVTRQPARGFGQRIADFFYGLLPIKDQL